MAFPSTIEELRKAGYRFDGESDCKGCGVAIEWWITPNGKKMPVDHGTAMPHWKTCPQAELFRKER